MGLSEKCRSASIEMVWTCGMNGYKYRMARRVLMAEISGERVLDRPRFGWMDVVKVALGNRGMTAEAE